jgi:cbb3-type cytochrome c oxidase subunit III
MPSARGMKRCAVLATIACATMLGQAQGAAPPPDAEMREVKVTPEAAAVGKTAFAACAACHGADAEGRVGMAPRLASNSFLAAASDRMLRDTIVKGRAGTTMIPWGASMKPEQIDGVIAWLRTTHPAPAATLDESPLKGSVEAGADTWRAICSTCHGRSGAGYQESGSGTGIGRAVFLDTATNGFLRYIIRHGKDLTQMRAFAGKSPVAVANLTDAEIENVIAYLRAKAW